jgi:hypothetical protein
MSYFNELPDLFYQSPLSNKNSSLDYVRVKNLFRRVKIRDDLQNVFTAFNKYQIPDGVRPDNVAEELYGSGGLDWVVLLTAGITNVRDQWPLSNKDLYVFVENKYGADLNNTRFYETTEVKNSAGKLILPAGKVVDSSFQIPDPDNASATLNPVTAISNFVYETRKNDEKRSIYLLKPDYLQFFLSDMRRVMYYGKSSQFVTRRLVQTENTVNTLPL